MKRIAPSPALILPGALVLLAIALGAGNGFAPADAVVVSFLVWLSTTAVVFALAAGASLAARFTLRAPCCDSARVRLLFRVALATVATWWLARALLEGTSVTGTGACAALAILLALVPALLPSVRESAARRPRSIAVAGLAAWAVTVAANTVFLVAQYPMWHATAAVAGLAAVFVATGDVSRHRWRHGLALAGIAAGAFLFAIDADDRAGRRGFDPLSRLTRLRATVTRAWLGPREAVEADVELIAGRWGQAVSGRLGEERGILLVTIDTLRADHVGAYGYDRDVTPFLDRFAEEAVVFERAYAQSPASLGSILSIFTGRYPASLNRWRKLAALGAPIQERTLAQILADEGWRTIGVPAYARRPLQGVFSPFRRGFAEYPILAGATYPKAELVCAEGLRRLATVGGERWFLWLHFLDVHSAYEEETSRYGEEPIDLYDGGIRHVDDALARFFEDAGDRLEDAVVVIHSDHGEEFGEHGGRFHGSTLYEEQVHVPMMIRAPGVAPRRVRAPVENVDLVPTLLELAGVTPPLPVHGDSLVPVLHGDEPSGLAVTQVLTSDPFVSNLTAAIDGDLKGIVNHDTGEVEVYDVSGGVGERPSDRLSGARAEQATALVAAARVVARTPPPVLGPAPTAAEVIAAPDWRDPETLRAWLRSPDLADGRRAMKALVSRDDRGALFAADVEAFMVRSAHDAATRAAVAEAIEGDRAFTVTVRAALDQIPGVGAPEYLDHVGRHGTADQAAWLMKWASTRGARGRTAALITSCFWKDARSVEFLEGTLGTLDPTMTVWALEALAWNGAGQATETLRALALARPYRQPICLMALRALEKLRDPHADAIVTQLAARPTAIPLAARDHVVNTVGPRGDSLGHPAVYEIYRVATPGLKEKALAWLARRSTDPSAALDRLEARRQSSARLPPDTEITAEPHPLLGPPALPATLLVVSLRITGSLEGHLPFRVLRDSTVIARGELVSGGPRLAAVWADVRSGETLSLAFAGGARRTFRVP